jgi:profilin
MANGTLCEGQKYQFLRDDGKALYFKKKGIGGLSIQKSKTAIVIGHYAEGSQAGFCNKAVGVIADYLESLGM